MGPWAPSPPRAATAPMRTVSGGRGCTVPRATASPAPTACPIPAPCRRPPTWTAALTGPLSYPDAVALLERVEKELPADRILTDHGYCYPPPAGDDPVTVLAPLYPDRLAEDFLALSLPGHHDTGLRPQPWAP